MACGVEVEERFSHGLLVKVHNSGQPKTGEMTSKMVIKLNEKWPLKKKVHPGIIDHLWIIILESLKPKTWISIFLWIFLWFQS